MKTLRFAILFSAAVIVMMLIPRVLLNAVRLAVPKLLVVSATLAIALIPIEIGLFLAYFNTLGIRAFLKGVRLRSPAKIIKASLVLPFGDLLAGYALVTAIKTCWLH